MLWQAQSSKFVKNLVPRIILLLTVLLINFGQPVSAAPQSFSRVSTTSFEPSTPECWPLDVVVLIDESLSMSRPSGNDPQGYRFKAAKRILSLLISNRRSQCPDAIHRIGVIAFGDYVQTALDLVSIDLSKEENRDTWSKPYEEAIDEIAKYRVQNGTDPKLAFQAADQMLSQAPRLDSPQGYGARRQVIILLTDGKPEGVNVGRTETYMRTLYNELNDTQWRKRSIWIVALNDKFSTYLTDPAFDGKTIGQVWQEIAERHNGRLDAREYNAEKIPTALNDIIDAEFGQPGKRIQCGDFYVDPYLQSVRLVFSKRLEYETTPIILSKLDDVSGNVLYQFIEGEPTIVGPDTKMTLLSEDGYREEATIEEYTLNFPVPGRWHFELQDVDQQNCRAGVDARQTPQGINIEFLQVNNVLPQVSEAPYYDTEVPTFFAVQVTVADGVLFEETPGYPLTITGTVKLPDGSSQLPDGSPYPAIAFQKIEEGTWNSQQSVLAPVEGMYSLQLTGYMEHYHEITATNTVELRAYAAVTRTLTFEGRKFDRLSFAIQEPVDGISVPCNTVDIENKVLIGQPIPVAVQLLDPNGEPADTSYYLTSEPNQTFTATFLGTDGNAGYLSQSGGSASGLFEGVLLADETAVVGCGQVTVQVDFVGSVDSERFILPKTTNVATLNRVRSEGVLATITAPTADQKFLLHPDFMSASKANVVMPVELNFSLQDLSGKLVDPKQVAATTPEALYTAWLIGPELNQSEALTLTLKGTTLSATGGLTMTQDGAYRFEIMANPQAFKDGYIPADSAPIVVNFIRRDLLWTSPATFKTVAVSSALLLAFLIGLAIYLLTGAPRGTVEITEYGLPNNTLAGPFALGGGRFPTITGRSLPGLGIKRIRAKKAKSFEGNPRAAQVTVIDSNGQEIFNGVLEVDQPTPLALSQDAEIVYH